MELSHQLNRLAELISRESRALTPLAETQDELRTLLRQMAQRPTEQNPFPDELRAELRLMSRTIAAALSGQRTS